MTSLELYLRAGEFIDSGDADLQAFAKSEAGDSGDDISRAVKLYYAVRDKILYDPYHCGEAQFYFRASD